MSVKPSNPALIGYLIIALYVPSGLYAKTDPMVQNKNDKLTEDDEVRNEDSEMPSEQSKDGWLQLVSLQFKKTIFRHCYIRNDKLWLYILVSILDIS